MLAGPARENSTKQQIVMHQAVLSRSGTCHECRPNHKTQKKPASLGNLSFIPAHCQSSPRIGSLYLHDDMTYVVLGLIENFCCLQVLRMACFSVYAVVAIGISSGALPWTCALVLLSLPMVSIPWHWLAQHLAYGKHG